MSSAGRWGMASGLSTLALSVFTTTVVNHGGWWWAGVVIVVTAFAMFALWRSVMSKPLPHPLRVEVDKFTCELSKAQNVGHLGKVAVDIEHKFRLEGLYALYFPTAENFTRPDLNQAAVCFQEMLGKLQH
jgi:membrane protein implicated in regulation of membrane protease activity